jgi:hypothetical protein
MSQALNQLLFLTLFFTTSNALIAQQNLFGLWEMSKVEVGDQTMTPVAKWTQINPDGTYQTGNGWLQNGAGTWTYDKKNNAFEALDPNGIKDEFGPFTVSFLGKNMQWQRMEEGMKVIVTLKPIEQLPKATADRLKGLWDLCQAEKDGQPILATIDPEEKQYLFIRWDRIYEERDAEGQESTGYWHIHGHKPELTLLSHNKEKEAESWKVAFEEGMLVLSGISDSNKGLEYRYKRLNSFPK